MPRTIDEAAPTRAQSARANPAATPAAPVALPPEPGPAAPSVPRASTPAKAAPSRRGTSKWPRGAAAPVLVEVRRGGIVESRHRGHVAQVGSDGRVERAAGDPDTIVTLRSTVKPFTLIALIESGAADAFELTPPELAVMAASHTGEDLHVRTLQAVFRRANVSQSVLACGAEGMPLDALTAARLARDGEAPGPIRHMCSGHHAASILLSRHAGWTIEDYWRPEHPSQVAARDAVARVYGVAPGALQTATDACGLQTYAFRLSDVARAFAFLADPERAPDPVRTALAPAVMRVRNAMLGAPEMLGGTRDAFETSLMKALPGAIVAKGGAEALLAVALLPGARGAGTPPGGLALKIEDGDGRDRAAPAVAVEALAQLGVLGDASMRQLGRYHRRPMLDPRGALVGEATTAFQLAPISELA